VVQIDQAKLIRSQNPKDLGTEKVIISCTILASEVAKLPAGTRDVAQILSSKHVSSAGNYKAFLIAALGGNISESSLSEELIEASYGPSNPLRGRLVSLNCFNKLTREKKDYTVHKWDAIPEEKQAALRAQLAANGKL
jgi:hypothetical protein